MSKFRFAGTLEEIVAAPGKNHLLFRPDREYVSSFKKDKGTTFTYAILQPDDKRAVGYAFEFKNTLKLECDVESAHMHVGTHYTLLFTTDLGKGIVDVTFSDIPAATKKKYAIESIRVS